VIQGRDGDMLLHGKRAVRHIGADCKSVLCSPGRSESPLMASPAPRHGARNRGCLFTDDLLFLARTPEGYLAHPGAAVMSIPRRQRSLGFALDSGPASARRRARFELLADVSEGTPIRRLLAGADVAPAELAATAEEALRP
jgi:hypothetical protein